MINWQDYHAYRVFDEFIDRFVLQQKSYITKHDHKLDLRVGITDIKKRFVEEYDKSSDKSFTEKLEEQFAEASKDAKIIFANLEYLWAMPYCNITPERKLEYVQRWFAQVQIHSGDQYFFGEPHTIANPGQWNNQNKYWEICSVMRVVEYLLSVENLQDVSYAKQLIEQFAYNAVYAPENLDVSFKIKNRCATNNALLHLSHPDKYESIVAYSDKNKIIETFGALIQDPAFQNREEMVKAIKTELYNKFATTSDHMRKERWFFYQEDVKPLWKKTSKKERNDVGIRIQIESEENARDLDDSEVTEGEKHTRTTTSLSRSAQKVKQAKKRDNYSCQACGFHYQKRIIQVHHLDPLGESKSPRKTKLADLITLCPNCHYLAHHLIPKNSKYKQQNDLIPKLKEISKATRVL